MSPVVAQSKHLDPLKQCPLLGVERTLAEYSEMSAYDPKRTSAGGPLSVTNGTILNPKSAILCIPDVVLGVGEAMRRRDFIKVIAGSAITWPLTTHAQQDRVRRIGVLITLGEDDPQGQQQVQTLLQSLQELGWKRGTNLEIDLRWGGTNNERIQMMAKELVAGQPDVIQVATTPGTAAVLRETRTIPVVFSIVSDPVGSGFVASLSHPGGNATGFINIESSM